MEKKFLIIMALATVVLVSCSKDKIGSIDPVNNEPTKINDIIVPTAFTWSTGKMITINVTGLPTIFPVTSTLVIGSTDGTELYKDFHDMSQDLTIKVTVPAIETVLKLTYGSVTYDVPITGSKADFSFIPVIQDTNN